MSNQAYDEFCKASIPDLTTLDRQLLGHYVTRFNEGVIPPRAWPPRSELIRITGARTKSISRSLGRLTRRGFLIRVTLASKDRGLKAEYAVNRSLIRSCIQVTDEVPEKYEVTDEVETGNPIAPLSNSGAPEKALHGYPKPNKPNKPTNVHSYDRFNEVILKHVPIESLPITGAAKASDLLQAYKEYKDYKYHTKHFDDLRPLLREELRNLQGGKNYEESLDVLDRKGATVEEVARFLNSQNLTNSHNVGGLVATLLSSYADSYRSVKPVTKPAWCGLCESPENRIEEYAYEIKSFPAGASSRVCRACG